MQNALPSMVSKARVMRVVLALTVASALLVAPSVAAEKTEHGYVTSALLLPETVTEVNSYLRDVDGDGDRENRLGGFFATLYSYGINSVSVHTNEAIDYGNLLMLHSLRTPSLANTKNATWQVLYGEPTETPDFSGSGSFTVDSQAPRSLRLATTISRHRVRTASGVVPLRLSAGTDIFTINLKKAKISAKCYQEICGDGAIKGAITAQQIKTVFLPQLVDAWNAIVQQDCPSAEPPGYGCMADSEGKALLGFFDANDDKTITTEEVRTNPEVRSFLKPDLDLAGDDGVRDAVSIGFGFEAVRAQLVRSS